MSKKTGRVSFCALAPMAAVGLTANSGMASNFASSTGCSFDAGNNGGTPAYNCVSFANNGTRAIRKYSLGDWTTLASALNNADGYMSSQLGISVYQTSTDDLPDVKIFDGNHGDNDIIGWVDCPLNNTGWGFHSGSSQRWCRGQNARFNAYYQPGLNTTTTSVVMHELGHTIGLRHRTSEPGPMSTVLPLTESYTTHDRSHVSGFGPYN